MAQKAILCFRDYLGKDLISGITQPSNVGSHKNLNGANDFNGTSANDQVDLLAPYDCVVKAIARGDNTVFFESVGAVETPIGTFAHCWFMCTHINDNDFNTLGIKVGKVFKQGTPCYTEGIKGIGSGYHIHMEQGIGTFGGGNLPYYKSSDTYYLNGKTYYTYYPNTSKGSYEYPIYDMFFLKNVTQYSSQAEKEQGHKYYSDKWKVDGKTSTPSANVKDLQNKINSLTTENATLKKQNDNYKKIIESVRKAIGG